MVRDGRGRGGRRIRGARGQGGGRVLTLPPSSNDPGSSVLDPEGAGAGAFPEASDGSAEAAEAADDTVRVRLDVAYDGTGFSGWARQDGLRTVAGDIEAALAIVLRLTEPPALTVAGRTDAGVHARGQVAHVDVAGPRWAAVPGRMPCGPGEALTRRLAGLLPRDVRVLAAAPAPPGFDARFAALARRYAYRICDDPGGVDPLRRAHVLWHPRDLDVDAMDAACRGLVGEHDFAAFCRRREGAGTVRRVLRLGWAREADGLLVADVEADAFCHHMVRALVGACLAVGEGRRPVGWPAAVLAAGVKDSAVAVVPALGLTLEEVRYPPDAELAARARETRRPRRPRQRYPQGASPPAHA